MVKNNNVDSIPEQFATLEEAGEFWDTHDLADYWDSTDEVALEVDLQSRRYLVAVDPELVKELATVAHQRGLSTETLINLWLNEMLHQVRV